MLFWRSCSTTAKLFKHLLTYLSQKREQSQLWLLFGFSVESSHYTALLKFQSFSLLVPYQDLLDANSSNMISCCTFYLCWDRLINLSTNLADYLYTHLSMSLSSRQQFQVHKVEVRRLFWRWVFPSIRLIATLNLWWLLKVICLSIFLCIRACLCLYPFAYHTLKQLNKQTNKQSNKQSTNKPRDILCLKLHTISLWICLPSRLSSYVPVCHGICPSINHVTYSFRLSMHVNMCVRTSIECELDKKKIYVPPLGMKYWCTHRSRFKEYYSINRH